MYKLKPTREARDDVRNLAAYMINSLKNLQAANIFFLQYSFHSRRGKQTNHYLKSSKRSSELEIHFKQ